MKKKAKFGLMFLVLSVLVFNIGSEVVHAGDVLNMVIMVSEDPATEAPKYAALAEYLKVNIDGIDGIELETAKDYPTAVSMFESGEVDGMFSGSFVAAIFIKKGVAVPVVRPVSLEGVSTYKALIVAPEGTSQFKDATDFKGKSVAYCALASSGEVFARALIGGDAPEDHYTPMIMKSHDIAARAVMVGDADYAIVKNLAYKDGAAHPGTMVIGSDSAENPNNTLILTPKIYAKYGQAIEQALTAVEHQDSQKAKDLKDAFKIKGFTKTTEADFIHTYENLKKAKIDGETFDFKW